MNWNNPEMVAKRLSFIFLWLQFLYQWTHFSLKIGMEHITISTFVRTPKRHAFCKMFWSRSIHSWVVFYWLKRPVGFASWLYIQTKHDHLLNITSNLQTAHIRNLMPGHQMTWNAPKLSQKDDISFSDNFLAFSLCSLSWLLNLTSLLLKEKVHKKDG